MIDADRRQRRVPERFGGDHQWRQLRGGRLGTWRKNAGEQNDPIRATARHLVEVGDRASDVAFGVAHQHREADLFGSLFRTTQDLEEERAEVGYDDQHGAGLTSAQIPGDEVGTVAESVDALQNPVTRLSIDQIRPRQHP